ncbi:MAG: hypothetical protein ACR2ND_10230 [Solirubrobacteraceae bacterium]
MSLERASFWTVRPAANRKPATYTCPICGGFLPALSAHMLIAPEGDATRRRHAHTSCVLRARRSGALPLREDAARSTRGAHGGLRLPSWLRRSS